MNGRFFLRGAVFAVCFVLSMSGNLFAKEGPQAKTVTVSSGSVKLVLRGERGTFQIYALGEDGSETAVFSGADAFTSTYFSLLAGKKEYLLSSSGGAATGAKANPDGGTLVYKLYKIADVTVDFSFARSPESPFDDIVKVRVSVINKGKKRNTFALKGVFDTVLGEKTQRHFSTADIKSINAETQFHDMSVSRWILSQGQEAAVQFLLYGADTTKIEEATLGNKDVLSLPMWCPVFVPARSFDSVTSYNNSALAVNWPKAVLESGAEANIVFYIALSADGNPPQGEAYIASFDKTLPDEAETKIASERAVPEWKLNKAYVDSLLQRIRALSDYDDNTDELDALNAELDAILEQLRQQ
ncbi:hypothetical protein HMPREF1325_0813 [Treponema socranskii subsp. socranskii VPI DR56BR1116 = ATCC 35536]|uniref:CARDB domain protein n=1 Tax=Treponema socranskii subsp. socranskii VPI DR56BR1116 = ATCC 35536 TaxID=1125725 RepID=U1GUA7_TRESO|nr:hypothetical protein [Treponema socranskii]ERF60179.1 hypothetical protein HMPREF1325_0813 [Treponema socranskii subsp. socranskii VPI DR56BR1116 = ATCC 35536]